MNEILEQKPEYSLVCNNITNLPGIIIPNILFNTTLICKLQCRHNGLIISTGTGFFYTINNHLFIVTNKHVVDNCDSLYIYYNSANNNEIIHNCSIVDFILIKNDNFFVHSDSNIDLCFIKINNIVNKVFALNKSNIVNIYDYYNKYLPNSSYYPNIIMRGFPNHDVKFPLCRTGILSSSILENNNSVFIGDIMSISGYSGSPTFITFASHVKGSDNVPLLFLGVNSGYKYEPMHVFKPTSGNKPESQSKFYCKSNTMQANIINALKILDIENYIITLKILDSVPSTKNFFDNFKQKKAGFLNCLR